MNPHLLIAEPLPEYRVKLVFENGEKRCFDATPFLDKGVFQKLRNPAMFAAAKVVAGSLEWPGEIDLSYDTLYLLSQPEEFDQASVA